MSLDQLKELLAAYLPQGSQDLEPSSNIFDAGLDSMGAFLFLDDLASAGYQIEFTDLVAHPTLHFLREATA